MTEMEEKILQTGTKRNLYCNIIGYGAYKYPDRILCRGVCQGKGSYGRNAEAFPAYRKRSDF